MGSANQRNRIAFRIGCRFLFHFSALGLLDQFGIDDLLRRLCRRARGTTTFKRHFFSHWNKEKKKKKKLRLILSLTTQVLATEWDVSGERKGLLPQEKRTATDLQTLWDFEGILKYSPIFYGFYSNAYETNEGYKLPFAYFFTGLVLYMYSFVAILRKYVPSFSTLRINGKKISLNEFAALLALCRMAKNSRMAKLSDKDDECTFTWKLFTGWDFMIGHPETGENRRSAITLGFKEALLEEAEKERATEKLTRNVICRRLAANFLVLVLLCSSAYIVVLVVERSTEPEAESSWWRQNEITVILSLISIIFPVIHFSSFFVFVSTNYFSLNSKNERRTFLS